MKNILKKRIRFIGIIIGVFLAINVALSFAYIRGGSVGSESVSTIALTGGSVNVRYSGGDAIVANSIVPGYETTKQFTISSEYGEGHEYYNLGLWYQINLVVDKNEFGDGSLTYSLSLDAASDDDGMPATNVEYIPIPSGQNLTGIIVGTGKLDNDNKSHVYNLKITYAETSTDQSEEIGSKFEAHITLTNPKIARIIFDLNGGTYTSSTTKYIPLGMAVSIEEPTKEGYAFNGWKITSGDGTVSGNKIIANSLAITVQAQYKANVPAMVNFASDSWSTIAANVRAKKEATKSVYSVGSEKEVAIGGTKYTVRIANNSNYDCSLESKTACGFVVEFVDIVEQRAMNSSSTNVGGWPATAMRKYLNGDFKAKLPSDLQSVIADTTVISGHGSTSGETNFTSTDKIYLLSAKEIWGNCTQSTCHDTATGVTRQLDYYANNNVTTSNYGSAVKKFNGTAAWWWLRGASASGSNYFGDVNSGGGNNWYHANGSGGVAPAFRIE